ncbi:hypothetical protein C0989_000809 [Termitomyces sp. Mn162]|nr:hypothetical protein C0989_000809 [Termitomyces sp. Mn162]
MEGNAIKEYSEHVLLKKTFDKVNDEYKLSIRERKPQRIHGDNKSQYGFCMSILQERVAGGVGAYRVISIYEGTNPIKEKLIMKAQFGGEIQDPVNDSVNGLQVRTAILFMFKVPPFFLSPILPKYLSQDAGCKHLDGISVEKLAEVKEDKEK